MTHGTTFMDPALLDEIDEVGRTQTATSALMTIGGARAVAAVVDEFYRRLLDDPVTAPYFAGRDLDGIKRHQVLMLVKVLGGPDRYTGRGLDAAHAGLGIGQDVYARVCLYLLTVMHECGVPMDVLVASEQVLRAVQDQIVAATPGAEAGR